MRFRDGSPEDLDRAREEVAAWRQGHPQGTGDQLVIDLIGRFRPDYGPVLRSPTTRTRSGADAGR